METKHLKIAYNATRKGLFSEISKSASPCQRCVVQHFRGEICLIQCFVHDLANLAVDCALSGDALPEQESPFWQHALTHITDDAMEAAKVCAGFLELIEDSNGN